jgi:hypothetical protein
MHTKNHKSNSRKVRIFAVKIYLFLFVSKLLAVTIETPNGFYNLNGLNQ